MFQCPLDLEVRFPEELDLERCQFFEVAKGVPLVLVHGLKLLGGDDGNGGDGEGIGLLPVGVAAGFRRRRVAPCFGHGRYVELT